MEAALLPLDDLDREMLEALCSDEECARLKVIRNQPKLKRKLASSALSRAFLAYRLGGTARDWQIIPDAAGAPRAHCRNRQVPVHMSRSHSAGFAVVSISADCPVGIDVERIAPHVSDPGFADHWFSGEERAFLAGAGDDGQEVARRFFRLWTLKEAYLKARGLGFALPPETVSLAKADAMPFFRLPPEERQSWTFESHRLGTEHCLSFVARAAGIDFSLHETGLVDGALIFAPAGSRRLVDTRTFHAHPEP